jgi:hypothetical protein
LKEEGRKMLDFGFWILDEFSTGGQDLQEGGEEKAETGDWRPERKGRATGSGDRRIKIAGGRPHYEVRSTLAVASRPSTLVD